MKQILIFIVFLNVSFSFGQTKEELMNLYDEVQGKSSRDFSFSMVDTISYQSKDDLYYLAKSFFVEKFQFPKEMVLQLDEKNKGVIAGSSSFSHDYTKKVLLGKENVEINYFYYLKIQCRQGRYKAEVKDISYTVNRPDIYNPKEYKLSDLKKDFKNDLKETVKTDNKRSVRNIREPDKQKERINKESVKLAYNILKGAEEGVQSLFLSLKKHMVIEGIEHDDDTW